MTCLDNATKEQLASLCKEKEIPVLWEEPMKHYTSFQIGGPASAVCIPKNREQLSCLLSFLRKMQINHWFVGNGSNLLISDEGLKGVVILLDSDFDEEILISNTILEAPAGKKLSSVCAAACRAELTGLEFAWGIPGSVGGAVYMNAGAYGGEMKDRLIWVEYLDLDGNIQRVPAEKLNLSYRHSCFMEQEYQGVCIIRAAFSLEKGEQAAIQAEMDRIIGQRKEKQPLDLPSAGSTFKRPQGAYAAQLIDQCGLRGFTVGGAQVSTKHTGFVVNIGGATCQDVLELARQVKECVKEKTGFELEMEVRLLP
ncbi:UDP-N-acetylmuramate dehydrogenase [Negativibacillus massiliensis]|uniref:UDP-N-acetylmuramate dehydrogenase n=1 Tax=Negativibacillus massiliensis TaxID=1871035 RepID=UPI000335FC29|nr:UDP-N-acetylmuramate dehydrogenase [Negativibacillus massiliensis]CDA76735.1 uDP-N-acetylenolpyruvoylglucosamine reductase [Clostridium sp. CAG:242]